MILLLVKMVVVERELLLFQEIERDRDTKVLTSLIQLKVSKGREVADRMCTYMMWMVVTRVRHMHWGGWGKLLQLLWSIDIVVVIEQLQTHQLLLQVVIVVGTRMEDGDTYSTIAIGVTITLAIEISVGGVSTRREVGRGTTTRGGVGGIEGDGATRRVIEGGGAT